MIFAHLKFSLVGQHMGLVGAHTWIKQIISPVAVGTASAILNKTAVAAGNQVSKNVINITRLLFCSRHSERK